MSWRLVAASVFMATLGLGATHAAAQAAAAPLGTRPEVRADVIFGARPTVQGGAGIQVPFGYYVRVGADALVGLRAGRVTGSRAEGRADVLARFLLDPFRQSPVGVSVGAGLSARFESGERTTPLLLVALELEGRRATNGWVPALQAGLGGGARIGLVLRRGDAAAR